MFGSSRLLRNDSLWNLDTFYLRPSTCDLGGNNDAASSDAAAAFGLEGSL